MTLIDCTSTERAIVSLTMEELQEIFYALDHAACGLLCAGQSARAEEFEGYAERWRDIIGEADYLLS